MNLVFKHGNTSLLMWSCFSCLLQVSPYLWFSLRSLDALTSMSCR